MQRRLLVAMVASVILTGLAIGGYVLWSQESQAGTSERISTADLDTTDWREYRNAGIRFKYPPTGEIVREWVVTTPVVVNGKARGRPGDFSVAIEDEKLQYYLRMDNAGGSSEKGEAGDYRDGPDFRFRARPILGATGYERLKVGSEPEWGRVFSVRHGSVTYNLDFYNLDPETGFHNEPIYEAVLGSIQLL